MPAPATFIPDEAPASFVPDAESDPGESLSRVKPTAYEAADLSSMRSGLGKAPSGMELGNELMTALATGIPRDIGRLESAAGDALTGVIDTPPNLYNRAKGLSPGDRGYVAPIGKELVSDSLTAGLKPLLNIPEAKPLDPDSPVDAVAAEVTNLLLGIPKFMSSPIGAMTAGVGSGIKAAATPIRYAFAADMLKNMADQAPELYRTVAGDSSSTDKAKAITRFLGTGAMAALLTHPEMKGEKPKGDSIQGPPATGESLRMTEGSSKEPPSASAPLADAGAAAEVGATPTADQLVGMKPEDFTKFVRSTPGGFGAHVTQSIAESLTADDISKLTAHRDALSEQTTKLNEDMSKLPKDKRGEFFNESGAGSIQLKEQALSEIIEDFRKNNPESATEVRQETSDINTGALGAVGMGGAKPAEFSDPGNPDTYGVAERVREERAKAGQVDPVEPGKGISAPDSVDRGRELKATGSDPESSMAAFESTKKLSSDDMALARAHGEELAFKARKIEERFGTDSPEYRAAYKALSDWDRRSKVMQTEWHKTGMAQQGETDIDTGTFTGLQRAFKDATDKDFTPDQADTAKKRARKVRTATTEAESAKKTLFDHLQSEDTRSNAEKSALDAAHKTVREAAARLADKERKAGAIDAQRDLDIKRVQEDAQRKALSAAQKTINEAAVRMADAQTKSRVAKTVAERDAAKVQEDAAKRAIDAAHKTVTENAARLARKETVLRVRKAANEKRIAERERAEAQKAIDKANESVRMAAIKSAREEVKNRVAKSDTSKFVWAKAREYIAKGMDDFDDIRNKLATDLGMKVDDVTRALAKDRRTKFLSDDLWRKQQVARRIDQEARRWLRDATLPGYRRALESVPKILFGLKVGFHGTVALGTHAPMVAFQPEFWGTYIRDFGKMYQMVGSRAYYETQVQDLLRRDNYTTARRAGLVNDPFQHEDFNSPDVAKYFAGITGMGNRGYSVLKILRQDMFDQHWNQLPKTARIAEVAKAIADSVNHATGVVKVAAPKGANVALFAPRLEASRVAWMAVDPAKSLATFMDWKNASEGDKHFAMMQVKEKAWVAGTMFGLLSLNQGFLSATGSKQKINGLPQALGGKGFDPMESDFLKFKAAGMDVSYGNAMLAMARLPVRLATAIMYEGKLSKMILEDERVYKIIGDYLRSQMSPFAGTATDLALGRDYAGRPLPRAGFGLLSGRKDIPKRLQKHGIKSAYSWPEYSSEQFSPIPISEGIKEVWGKGGLGMSDQQIKNTLKAWGVTMVMMGTGGRISEDWNLKK